MTNPSGSSDRYREIIAAARRAADEPAETHAADPAMLTRRPAQADGLPPASENWFPGYELVREIHRGGQGVVYQAIQKSTKRKVAIKVLREGALAGPQDVARLQREAQILGQFRHPHIVAIHDSGSVAGHLYLVMDYIAGQPLDSYIASEPLSLRARLELFARICDAVHAAHLRGVIHRDLKPSNIRIDPAGAPHLLDFGLAKIALGGVSDASVPQVMTRTGAFVGSLPWASPEQAAGASDEIDLRTDVYSLGVILFQMLTQRFPYPVTGPMRDVLETICRTPPARPSAAPASAAHASAAAKATAEPLRQAARLRLGLGSRGGIDDELDTITLKCLAKERERRYQSAGELARDVRRYLAGEPIEAKRDSGWYVLRKTLTRYKAPTALAACFLVAGFGFGTLMTARYYQAIERAARAETTAVAAVAAEQQARQQAERAQEKLSLIADVADIPIAERFAEDDPDRRYMLIGPHPGAAAPPDGWKLLVVLPGGDGSADFSPFVRRILKYALPADYLVVQPIAKEWSPGQFERVVWPTRMNPCAGMRFTTEELVESVVADVRLGLPIDARYVFALGWSSGGPPVYALTLGGPSSVTGSFVAMSVFRATAPPAAADPAQRGRIAGHPYVIMHSPDDALIPLTHPQRAADALRAAGARVHPIEYAGGHGWHAGCYADLQAGLRFLERNHAQP